MVLKNIFSIIAVVVLFTGIAGFSLISAAAPWSAPVGTPPSNNIDAPVNIGSSTQYKTGAIAVENLVSFGGSTAYGEMRSPKYCDLDGKNCLANPQVNPLDILSMLTTYTKTCSGQDCKVFCELGHIRTGCASDNSRAIVENGQSGCKGPNSVGASSQAICLMYKGDDYTKTRRFITKYSALMSDPEFITWANSSVLHKMTASDCDYGNCYFQDDLGFYVRNTDLNNPKWKNTANYLCSYFMENGRLDINSTNNRSGADYGSDNNNLAYYWDAADNVWKSELHGDNGWIDLVELSCIGDSTLSRGLKWLRHAEINVNKDPAARSNPWAP